MRHRFLRRVAARADALLLFAVVAGDAPASSVAFASVRRPRSARSKNDGENNADNKQLPELLISRSGKVCLNKRENDAPAWVTLSLAHDGDPLLELSLELGEAVRSALQSATRSRRNDRIVRCL
jgi:hypothetical protein